MPLFFCALFVAGLGMLSWDSAAGFSEGTLPGPRPFGGHSRAQHHLVHDVAGTCGAPINESRSRPSHPETRTIILVVRARLLPSTADLRLRGDARAFSPRSLSHSLSLPLSPTPYPSFSLPLSSSHVTVVTVRRTCTSAVRAARGHHRFLPSTRGEKHARGKHARTHARTDIVTRNASRTRWPR